MSIAPSPAEHRAVLEAVSWRTYVALTEESDHVSGRITYDGGLLEIMSPSLPHESAKNLIRRLIEMFTYLRDIDVRSCASTTFKREDLRRGFEADESYYIQKAEAIRGKKNLDLTIDPPPDLVLEIDITHSSIDKLRLFASMNIPELWRYDGNTLWIGFLADGSYLEVAESRVLPGFPIRLAEQLLAERADVSETELIRRFAKAIEP